MLRVLIVICLLSAFSVEGKVYTQCNLAKALRAAGIPMQKISTFVCIAKYESNFNTKAINRQTGDYGIFQISHYFWCNDGNKPGKGCGVTCNSLLGDNISQDIKCVKTIYAQTQKQTGNGFTAWVTYKKHCSGNTSGFIKGCF